MGRRSVQTCLPQPSVPARPARMRNRFHLAVNRSSKAPVRKISPKGKSMASRKLLLLPGDGIGPETMAEVRKLIEIVNADTGAGFEIEEGLVGGSAYDAHGKAISDADMELANAADAVLFGAVGGPKWDGVPYDVRPEAGLLRLRKELKLFANLRPAICYPALADASSLKKEVVEGLDILIVRELTGGVYFGEPKEITDLGNGQKRAVDTQVYDTFEIERISGVAFELARTRRNEVCSMEKRNVMKSGVLWNEVVTATHKARYSDVKLSHMLADAGGMQLVRWPKQFDVIVTDNLFGDMLSDIAAMLTGSIGMLPSASLGSPDEATGSRKALYEPVHGSAPDIAGTGVANPIAMIASFAMCLRYSFNMVETADRLEAAIASVLDAGIRTGDIIGEGSRRVGTAEMGDAIIAAFR
jgi:3-isopropylmalate dehydrogenase